MSSTTDDAVRAEALGKRFGDRWVLRDVDLAVPRGTVLGLLGPNGAGKTTAVRILTTLLRPDAGRAWVAGLDVVREPRHVRPLIGLAGQAATVDELLTGRANLEMVARLYHLGGARARERATGLLGRFDLTDAGDRLVRTYSGGMRRRLDLAASLVASPPVLFLDEPTTGLDPHSRSGLWDVLRDLVREGTTIVLTTQYLEEADQLCDDIAVVDRGRIIAAGAPAELKREIGGERLVVAVPAAEQLAPAAAALEALAGADAQVDAEALRVSVPVSGEATIPDAVRALDAARVPIADVARRSPTLDEVFLRLTGRPAPDAENDPTPEEVLT
ncbi:MAG TPA: ATP-binding cassette domain-containing protein [Solirubrobacteraceae bacterium]